MAKILIIIGIGENITFGLSIDDYLSSRRSFKDIHEFLHKIYFSRRSLDFIILQKRKELYLIIDLIL